MIFLLLFSYVILCDFFPLYDFPPNVCAPAHNPEKSKDDNGNQLITNHESNINKTVPYGFQKHNQPALLEWILAIWIFTLFCEEIRQFSSLEAKTTCNKIIEYFSVFWNQLDVLAIILFYVGFVLRFVPIAECYCAARIILSVDLTIWFIRSLDIFAAVKRLGPKLVMIGVMTNDLMFFMLILTVFISGFGVSSYSLIYGTEEFTWNLPRKIINLAYWQIFGELNALETFETSYNANGHAVFILLVAYMALVSILLVNLLIAMFSNTFDRLQNDTDCIWKFQRYSLICEYRSRPSLPPPFILFSHLWRLTLYTLSLCPKSAWLQDAYSGHTNRTKYKITLDKKDTAIIEAAEDLIGDEVYCNHVKSSRTVSENDIQSPLETMVKKVRTFENRMQTISDQIDGLSSMVREHIKVSERRRLDHDISSDKACNNSDQLERRSRGESLLGDCRSQFNTRHQSNGGSDEQQSSIINVILSRKT
ncbi:unnamed protein product [Rotaria sordida]|uniref:Ion transport domain-containing protein n=1 Tax=Rotaria sordida TaxID=392033 RepID=A0A815T6Q2_9BILA|nr:unnamed protein product [Rotaria sordida]CAF4169212.1 unnamed protein product [Rotaria sordida]